MTDELKAEQIDRDAAADYWRDFVAKVGECITERAIRTGLLDEMDCVQRFARHRQQSILSESVNAEAVRVREINEAHRAGYRAAMETIRQAEPADVIQRLQTMGRMSASIYGPLIDQACALIALPKQPVNLDGEAVERLAEWDAELSPEQRATAIVDGVEWAMNNCMPAKGESSSSCERRRMIAAIAGELSELRALLTTTGVNNG